MADNAENPRLTEARKLGEGIATHEERRQEGRHHQDHTSRKKKTTRKRNIDRTRDEAKLKQHHKRARNQEKVPL